jgi:hypothetical protein
VVDIADPTGVQEVVGRVTPQGSGFAIQFVVPGSGQRTLLAFTGDQVKSAAAVEANVPSRWYQAGQGADLVIISQANFIDSVKPLKALREAQGWSVALMDVEDLYGEFGFGNKTPQALKDFLLRARVYWQKPPRFVLLVGDASLDPRNYLGLGSFDFVPTKLIDTAVLETASDDWFADLHGDGLPEMAVGRLSVRTVEEAQIVVSKIMGYEQSAGGITEVLLVADMAGDGDFDFEGASSAVGDLLPGALTVAKIFRSQFADDDQVHTQILQGLNSGTLLVNYFGHGYEEGWRGDTFTTADAEGLINGGRLPFVVSMTCLNGFFQDVYAASLGKVLLTAKQGGAVAVWASSGLTDPAGQAVMNKRLVGLLFNGESLTTLGEAAKKAKAAVSDQDVRRTWILFGDPTTRLKY